jgi:transposase
MQLLLNRCVGVDVHKGTIVGCVLLMEEDGSVTRESKTFGAMTRDLLELGDWLKSHRVTHAAMESTGSYGSRSITCWKSRWSCW